MEKLVNGYLESAGPASDFQIVLVSASIYQKITLSRANIHASVRGTKLVDESPREEETPS